MMYTIDLLKGRGIPIRNRRGGLLIIAVTIAVPVLIAMVMYSHYLISKIAINRIEISITDRDAQIKKMADAVKTVESLEKENATMKYCLDDVASAIGRNTQWSPIIQLIVENLPGTTVLNKLDVSLVTHNKQLPDKQDPKRLVNVPQNMRVLRISLFEYGKTDNGEKVTSFVNTLRKSNVLASKVDDIRIVAQEHDKADNTEVIRYDIDCVFKPQG